MELPEQLLQSLRQVEGFNEASFQSVHQAGQQVTSIRVNPAKWPGYTPEAGADQITRHATFSNASPVPWCPFGFYLPERPSFTLDPWLHAGMYYVQEASSMFLWQVLQDHVGAQSVPLKVLDLCAAPGGKTTLLTSFFPGALVVANEVIKQRAGVLTENTSKWGTGNVVVTNNDPRDFQRLPGYFDVLVIDAPCSGSGLFRRQPEAMAEWSEQNVQLCSERQQRILADAIGCLKENGLLIYSTCSYSQQENEDIADWLVYNSALTSLRCNARPGWHITEVQTAKTNSFGYRFYPDQLQGEGFFIAAFRKTNAETTTHRMPQLLAASKTEQALAAEWTNRGGLFFFKQNEHILAVEEHWQQDIALLQKNLYLKKAGVNIGAAKGKDWVPHHELALSTWVSSQVQQLEIDIEEALSYLRKQDVAAPAGKKGWCLVTYNGAGLGWLKALPNRVNNYYPVEWRILKA